LKIKNKNFSIKPIGHVESQLTDRASAPKQGREGSPLAWLVFDESVREALRDLLCGRRSDCPHLARSRAPERLEGASTGRSNPAGARSIQHALTGSSKSHRITSSGNYFD
jgi:hypothetical protein